MKSLPKISIVIPSYNKVAYIEETLESIVTQNYPNLEVIIQDGGSTDGSVEIIRKYAQKYPKIISWVLKQDKGQVDAINKGMKKATGDILAYINADDVYEKGALLKVGEYFAKNPETLWLAGRGGVIDEKGAEISKWVTAYKNLLLTINSYSLLLIVNYLMQPSVFLNKETYKKYGPFTGTSNFVMEYDLWLKIGKNQMPQVIKNYLSKFRLAKGTISTSFFPSTLSEDLTIAKSYTKNPVLIFFHQLNNSGRIRVYKAIMLFNKKVKN